MSKKEVRGHIISIISVSLFLILMTTFVYFPKQESLLASLAFLQSQRNFHMEELSSGILLHNATPVSDKIGLENDAYRFKIVNNSDSVIKYQIVFRNNEDKAKQRGMEVLPNRYLRYALYQDNEQIVQSNTLSDEGVLYTGTISSNSELTFNFKMWLSLDADNGAMNKIFIGKVAIEEIK